MPYFIHRRGLTKPPVITIAEFDDAEEAFKAVAQYNIDFPTAHHYITRKPCRHWREHES